MKSLQYASKRRLTNICCLVISLAFAKLIFAAYLSAGGVLFEFNAEKASSANKIAQENRNRIDATQRAALARLASNEGVNISSQNNDNRNALGKSSQNEFSAPMSSETIAPSNSRVSFLPKAKDIEETFEAKPASNDYASLQNTYVEHSDMINDDFILAKASASTANISRDQMRAELMRDMDIVIDDESLNYVRNQKIGEIENLVQEPVKNETLTHENRGVRAKVASLFNFVGTANAADGDDPDAYIRPDEDFSSPIPTPKVSGYTSPDSLEYKQSELNRKEEELLALQLQMNMRLQELNTLEGKLGGMVQDANALQGDKFKHLVETYSNMKARAAAQALTTLDEDIAVRILSNMRSKQSGEIFSYMNPVQAARLSEAMSQFSL